MTLLHPKFNIEKPKFDQGTFWGRAKHFFVTTNPVNILATTAQLEAARELLEKYKRGEINNVSEDELWRAKRLYDSAFHPDTGKSNLCLKILDFQILR